jgi:gallate dioxygenase
LAKIIGGTATSHTPTIGFALDTNKQKDPVSALIFEGYSVVGRDEGRREWDKK